MLLNLIRGMCGTAMLVSSYGFYLTVMYVLQYHPFEPSSYYIIGGVFVALFLLGLIFLTYSFRSDATKYSDF